VIQNPPEPTPDETLGTSPSLPSWAYRRVAALAAVTGVPGVICLAAWVFLLFAIATGERDPSVVVLMLLLELGVGLSLIAALLMCGLLAHWVGIRFKKKGGR
jgi:hypothetical protein